MLFNLHTHTNMCDGINTPDQMAYTAYQKGFSVLGFSGHAYMPDADYCMTDEKAYINSINRLKSEYSGKMQIFLGVEEDAVCPVFRDKYDYIIGSAHNVEKDGKCYPVDDSYERLCDATSAFSGDASALAEKYFGDFCDYILKRKPDIIGHFDLITKYDEAYTPIFSNIAEYRQIAKKYINIAAKSQSIFEVNTGAMARGLRESPYPSVDLLFELKKLNAKITLSSDCHDAQNLDFGFKESIALIKDIGFDELYCITSEGFKAFKI